MIFAPLTKPALVVLAGLHTCPDVMNVPVTVNFKAAEPRYIRSLTSAEIAKIQGAPVLKKRPGIKQRMLGLTKSRFTYHYNTNFISRTQMPSGATCFVVSEIKFDITYTPTVYIASDHKKSGCPARMIEAHEMRHMNTDIRSIRKYIPILKARMKTASAKLGARGPFPKRMMTAEKNRAQKYITDVTTTLLNHMDVEREAAQALHDAPPAYEKDMAQCKGRRR